MIPYSDENPTLRTPVMTYLVLATIGYVWVRVQNAGLPTLEFISSVCNLGMVAGELTGLAPVGTAVPLGEGIACVVDRDPINRLTPFTSMFLHGGWGHLLGNCLFLWVFGNNVEDSMGRLRFLVFYFLCGLVAAGAQVLVDPASAVPMVGASGAISGVLGAYLVLYPRVRVKLFLPPFFFLSLPAWAVLVYWFVLQVVSGLPELMSVRSEVSSGVAVWAHIGGFVAGALLIKVFENRRYTDVRTRMRHQLHPDHW
jgi:membrane associated rhomboid family serine protease